MANPFQENLARMFQLKNIFGVSQDEPNIMTGGMPPGSPAMNMNQGFTPQTQAQDQFRQGIETMPERNKPGKGRKIAAILAGIAGGPSTTDSIMYAPYYRQMGEWKAKMDPLGDLAKMENQSNTQERLYNQSINTNDIRRDAEARRTLEGQQKNDIAQKKLDLQMELANGGRAISDRDGNMFIVTKRGEVKDIDKTTLSFADKMELQNAGRMTIVNDQQEAARELAKFRAELEKGLIHEKGDVAKEVNAAKPSAANTQTPNEIKQEKINRAQQYVRDHPEVADWIKEDATTGAITLSPPTSWGTRWSRDSSKDAQLIKEFNNWVDQGIAPGRSGTVTNPSAPPKTVTGKNETTSPTRAAQVAPDNMIKVRNKKTGQTGQMKRSELGQYKDFEEIK